MERLYKKHSFNLKNNRVTISWKCWWVQLITQRNSPCPCLKGQRWILLCPEGGNKGCFRKKAKLWCCKWNGTMCSAGFIAPALEGVSVIPHVCALELHNERLSHPAWLLQWPPTVAILVRPKMLLLCNTQSNVHPITPTSSGPCSVWDQPSMSEEEEEGC